MATKTQHRSHHQELKEDALVTWAFQTWDRIQDNLRVLGITAGIIVAVILAAVWIRQAQTRAEGEANAVLAEASANYWQGGYSRAIQLSDRVLSDYKTTRAANEARRMKADALFWSGAFDSAATLYKDYLSHASGSSPVKDAVAQSLAFALESKHDFQGAGDQFQKLADSAPDRNSAADMLMCAARAYSEAGQADKARAIYTRVANDYKDTPFARDADVFTGELSGAVAKDTPHPAVVVPPKPTAPTGLRMANGQQIPIVTASAPGGVSVTGRPANGARSASAKVTVKPAAKAPANAVKPGPVAAPPAATAQPTPAPTPATTPDKK